jgi:hypothetical protein
MNIYLFPDQSMPIIADRITEKSSPSPGELRYMILFDFFSLSAGMAY